MSIWATSGTSTRRRVSLTAPGSIPPTATARRSRKMDRRATITGAGTSILQGGRPAVHIINKWPANALKVARKGDDPEQPVDACLRHLRRLGKAGGHANLYQRQARRSTTWRSTRSPDTIRTAGHRQDRHAHRSRRVCGQSGRCGAVQPGADAGRGRCSWPTADPAKALLAIPTGKTHATSRSSRSFGSGRSATTRNTSSWPTSASGRRRSGPQSTTQITTVMVMDEMPKPRDCYVLMRGQYDKHGEPVTAGTARRFRHAACRRAEQSPGAGRMDRQPGQSADRARRRQPALGEVLRHRHRRRRPRTSGRAPSFPAIPNCWTGWRRSSCG